MALAEDVQARIQAKEREALSMVEVRPGVFQSRYELNRGHIELELSDAELNAYCAAYFPGVSPENIHQAGIVTILHRDKGERETTVVPLAAKPVNRKNDLARFRVKEALAARDGAPPPVANAYERMLIREDLAERGGGEDPTQPGYEPDDAPEPDPVPKYPLPPGQDFMAAVIEAARAAVRIELEQAKRGKRAKPKPRHARNPRPPVARKQKRPGPARPGRAGKSRGVANAVRVRGRGKAAGDGPARDRDHARVRRRPPQPRR